MGRPAIDKYWKDKIWELRANEGGKWSAARMARELELIGAREGHAADPPHRTTVQRELQHIANEPPGDLQDYRYVRWPKTFATGLLPWESVRAVLDEVQALPAHSDRNLTVRRARWYWWLFQSAPGAPLEQLRDMARILAAAAVLGDTVLAPKQREAEDWLSFRAWSEPEEVGRGRQAYERAVDDGVISRWEGSVTIPDGTTFDQALAAMEEIVGVPADGVRSASQREVNDRED